MRSGPWFRGFAVQWFRAKSSRLSRRSAVNAQPGANRGQYRTYGPVRTDRTHLSSARPHESVAGGQPAANRQSPIAKPIANSPIANSR